MVALSLPWLHAQHAQCLASAAACRRDAAKGGTRWHTYEDALCSARLMIDAARNMRGIIRKMEARRRAFAPVESMERSA